MHIARLNHAPELFFSLQGEGISAGAPAAFLRLAGCNLHCSWCDSKHSWSNSIELPLHEVAARLRELPAKRVIITGGEPLLQANELVALLLLLPPDYVIEVETNGTLFPPPELLLRVNQWNVSPKLPHAGNLPNSLQPRVLTAFASLPHSWFKFVVTGEEDWADIAQLGLPNEKILLMPCAADRTSYRRLLPIVADICLAHHVRLSPRLHIELWNTRLGV